MDIEILPPLSDYIATGWSTILILWKVEILSPMEIPKDLIFSGQQPHDPDPTWTLYIWPMKESFYFVVDNPGMTLHHISKGYKILKSGVRDEQKMTRETPQVGSDRRRKKEEIEERGEQQQQQQNQH